MIQSDTLSQRPNHGADKDHDNKNITLLPNGMFLNLINTELLGKITDSNKMDKDATDAIKTLFDDESKTIRDTVADWTITEHEGKNVLFYKGRNYIPKNQDLRREIVKRSS